MSGRIETHVEGDRLVVDHADPVIEISAQLIDLIRDGGGRDCAIDGDILRIEAINRTVVYRIGEQIPDRYAYRAEWPD